MQKYEKKEKAVYYYAKGKMRNVMPMRKTTFIFHPSFFNLLLCCLLLSGCKKFEGDVTRPAWLQLDRIDVVRASSGENDRNSGWHTSDIDAVELIALYHGDSKETSLGTYQLPCRVPVLHDGVADYVVARPCVMQNGIAATRIVYPCLRNDSSFNVDFRTGETTRLGTYNATDNTSTVEVSYWGSDRVDELFFENFEPLASSIRMTDGQFEWISDDATGARSGTGYVRIHTSGDGTGTYLEITDSIQMDEIKNLYLEMDYHTDVEFRIGMRSPLTSGGADHTYYAINLYPTQQWTKVYINLGKLWSQMNHYPEFHVVFHTLNLDNVDGYTYIDNLKLIAF